jgi:hypothetical protein
MPIQKWERAVARDIRPGQVVRLEPSGKSHPVLYIREVKDFVFVSFADNRYGLGSWVSADKLIWVEKKPVLSG